MIENKIIEITKENTFDRDWAIFTQIEKEFKSDVNSPSIQDIVNKITFASQIDFILSDCVFHRRLYEAILWSFNQGGLILNLTYKNHEILSQLKGLKFNKLEKDDDISINYMCIKGKKDGKQYELAFLLEDNIIKLDSPINFKKEDNKLNDFLNGCEIMFIIDNKYNNKHNDLIEKGKEKKLNIAYIIKTQNFSKEIHDKFKDLKISLLVCDRIKPAIILLTKTNKLYCLKYYKNIEILFEIANLEHYVQDNLYFNNKQSRNIKELPKNFLCFNNNKIENCFIQDEKQISIEISSPTMEDFISENFDKSITDKHNDYSMECKVVKYRFVLNPPRFNSEYKISGVYDEIKKVAKKVAKLNSDVLIKIKDDVTNLISGTWIEKTIDNLFNIKNFILNVVSNYEYSNFDKYCIKTIDDLEENKIKMFNEVLNIYKSLNKGAEVLKYSKFDEEIDGYRKTIKDKERLIQDNIEVLSNKRRIEILSKKIEDLELLKQKFESKDDNRDIMVQNSFCSNYNKWLNKQQTRVLYSDSVTSVVKKDLSKAEHFENFLEKNLYTFNDYYDNFVSFLKQIIKCLVFPLEYTVYEKNNQNFIVINSLEENESVKNICKKYNLFTVAKE